MRIKTKRLLLRPVEGKDIKDIVEGVNNLNISKWLLVVPHPYTVKDAREWIKHCKEKAKEKPAKGYTFGIELREERKYIGTISLHNVNKEQGTADLGYWISQNYWRKGYGSEVLEAVIDFSFKKLKLRRLEAGVFAGNPSSGKLLEKFEFEREGMKKEARICKADGKIKDEYMYGLLRKNYK